MLLAFGGLLSPLERKRYAEFVRFALLGLLTALAACAPAPPPKEPARIDPASEGWYRETTDRLTAMDREAERLLERKEFDAAADMVTRGQPLQGRLLAVPQPTFEAMQAASDLDDLYGRMLLRNGRYGWARSFFQKNAARWKNWKPQTPESAKQWEKALAAIAECDRHL